MVQTVTISLERPIGSVRILRDRGSSLSETAAAADMAASAELSRQTKTFMQAAAALSAVTTKLNAFFENEVRQHNQQIAKLAVEIARKVLMQEVADGHYKIEMIVQEAIRNAPSRENVVVHLNPVDAAVCRQVQEKSGEGLLNGIKIEADPNVKPADCVVATPGGLVESFTETHLLHIAEALAHAQ
jgi:flagellar biosynthesis/type III secretory pathway protein FliH